VCRGVWCASAPNTHHYRRAARRLAWHAAHKRRHRGIQTVTIQRVPTNTVTVRTFVSFRRSASLNMDTDAASIAVAASGAAASTTAAAAAILT